MLRPFVILLVLIAAGCAQAPIRESAVVTQWSHAIAPYSVPQAPTISGRSCSGKSLSCLNPTASRRISADFGGEVLRYALKIKLTALEAGAVEFAGICDSACTLYLALPREQTCIAPGASFGFHLPYGTSPAAVRLIRQYMLTTYPNWVRAWIKQNGGLTRNIKRMEYDYAKRYLRPCADGMRRAGLERRT